MGSAARRSALRENCRLARAEQHRAVGFDRGGAPTRRAKRLGCRKILARVPKRSRHPYKFVEKFVHASGVSRIGNFARSGIEKPPRGTEINVREYRDQSQLSQHRHQTLDHTRAAEWTG